MLSKIVRVRIQSFLRKTKLLPIAEQVRYRLKKWGLQKKNREFINKNPNFKLPPAYLAFDAYSAPDWTFYKASGEETARFLVHTARQYLGSNISSVYEWGCGPARVIRNLPEAFGPSTTVFGSDYNPQTIEWCKKNLPDINFFFNDLHPPLNQPGNHFDFIYCISVFTHLGEETGLQWADELYRVLKPGGILIVTTSGDNAYRTELLENEKKEYFDQGIVVRGQYEEGKKMFLARHSPAYVRKKLLSKFDILDHVPAGFPVISQDCWIVQKSK